MKTFRVPTAALTALVALATIILGFLQLSVTILTVRVLFSCGSTLLISPV